MSTLFVDEPGVHLCRRGERLQLEKDNEVLGAVRPGLGATPVW